MKQAVKKAGTKKAFTPSKTNVAANTTKRTKVENSSTPDLQKTNLFQRFLEASGDCV